ncbi:hypothetical protein H5410_055696 [Solanum commersonii]|uniref:Uncharacterized protein n=1 Tax=Solanum commersonii TaxID=4109 RepID=A0A9J5WJ27_SOLCO|nr:hypothetical protein H5410_055696 [Solanum commersonii]
MDYNVMGVFSIALVTHNLLTGSLLSAPWGLAMDILMPCRLEHHCRMHSPILKLVSRLMHAHLAFASPMACHATSQMIIASCHATMPHIPTSAPPSIYVANIADIGVVYLADLLASACHQHG